VVAFVSARNSANRSSPTPLVYLRKLLILYKRQCKSRLLMACRIVVICNESPGARLALWFPRDRRGMLFIRAFVSLETIV